MTKIASAGFAGFAMTVEFIRLYKYRDVLIRKDVIARSTATKQSFNPKPDLVSQVALKNKRLSSYFRGVWANRKWCENFGQPVAGLACVASARMVKICHFRPPFLWFISFGGAKEMNIVSSAKPNGANFSMFVKAKYCRDFNRPQRILG